MVEFYLVSMTVEPPPKLRNISPLKMITTEIRRESFLASLQMVRAGLSTREFTEQSSCFAFKDGYVMTFNDEIACRRKVETDVLHGAIPAAKLLDILEKIPDPKLTIQSKNGELVFTGKGKGFAITKEKKIMLPIDQVDPPGNWTPLPKGFEDALSRTKKCVTGDETKFMFTCVHFHPQFMESCDNDQAIRHRISLGIKKPFLIRGRALDDITTLAMDSISVTASFVHFRKKPEKDEGDLIYSCRKYIDKYPDLSPVYEIKGSKIIIPRGLAAAAEQAGVFADDVSAGRAWLTVFLSPGRIKIKGYGNTGRYWTTKKIEYNGPELSFTMPPSLLREIADQYKTAKIDKRKIKITGGKDINEGGTWEYIARLAKIKATKD